MVKRALTSHDPASCCPAPPEEDGNLIYHEAAYCLLLRHVRHPSDHIYFFFSFLKSRSLGSLLRELLGVQGFGERRGLVGIGGYYGSTIRDGVGSSSSIAWDWLQVLPSK